jgi:hypothetical protein
MILIYFHHLCKVGRWFMIYINYRQQWQLYGSSGLVCSYDLNWFGVGATNDRGQFKGNRVLNSYGMNRGIFMRWNWKWNHIECGGL